MSSALCRCAHFYQSDAHRSKTITDSKWNNVTIAEIESSKTYNFNLSLDNEFGLVGSAFTPEYKISAVAYGAIKVKKDLYKSGTFQSTDYGTVDYVVQDVFESAGYIWTSFQNRVDMWTSTNSQSRTAS